MEISFLLHNDDYLYDLTVTGLCGFLHMSIRMYVIVYDSYRTT